MPKVISVIEVEEHEGENSEINPHRIVTRYYTLDGQLLAERDEFKESREGLALLNLLAEGRMKAAEMGRKERI